MKCFMEWLNENNGAIMVIITIIYVVATVAIMIANNRSAKSADLQLKEMKRQYEDTNRPLVEVEFLYINRSQFGLRFINNGTHTAQKVKIDLSDNFINSLEESGAKDIAEQLRNQKEKECVIGVRQHYDLLFGDFDDYLSFKDSKPANGRISYSDDQNSFESEFYFDFVNYMTIYSVKSNEEEILEKLGKIERRLYDLTESQYYK